VEWDINRVGRRLSFRFAASSASSFSLCAGLADTTTVPIFLLLRFWSCYRSPGGFPSQSQTLCPQRYLFPTFLHSVDIQLAVRRRTRSLPLPPLLACGSHPHEPTGSPTHWLIPAMTAPAAFAPCICAACLLLSRQDMTNYHLIPASTLPSFAVSEAKAKRRKVLARAARVRRANYRAFLKKRRLHAINDLAMMRRERG
jgi:hypothetical protein